MNGPSELPSTNNMFTNAVFTHLTPNTEERMFPVPPCSQMVGYHLLQRKVPGFCVPPFCSLQHFLVSIRALSQGPLLRAQHVKLINCRYCLFALTVKSLPNRVNICSDNFLTFQSFHNQLQSGIIFSLIY